ncbi:hydrolase [Robiginitalea sediminis]|uniref:hydrolase n=1 Tax=Robiginitalea sediminis TaxID=1982593 RepID=UPI000B4AAE62|nr:hydrolase [Robiginitalea sediminis]
MQKNIFLYAFVFAALIALYLAVSSSRNMQGLENEVSRLREREAQWKDSLTQSRLETLDMQYFSLANNDEALAYFEDLPLEDPSAYVMDRLLETNEQSGDNPLVPYEGMESDFKINKIKVLNHKWILADFSDGSYWGELLIEYELGEDLGARFTPMAHLLYTRSGQ